VGQSPPPGPYNPYGFAAQPNYQSTASASSASKAREVLKEKSKKSASKDTKNRNSSQPRSKLVKDDEQKDAKKKEHMEEVVDEKTLVGHEVESQENEKVNSGKESIGLDDTPPRQTPEANQPLYGEPSASLKLQIRQMQSELDIKDVEMQRQKERHARVLRGRDEHFAILESELRQIREQLRITEDDRTLLRKQLSEADLVNSKATHTAKKGQGELKKSSETIENLSQRLSVQQAKAEKGAKDIKRLMSQLEAKDRDFLIMQNSLETSKKRQAGLEEDVQQAEQVAWQYQQDLKNIRSELDSLQRSHIDLIQKLKAQELRAKTAEQSLERTREHKEMLESEVSRLKAELDRNVQQIIAVKQQAMAEQEEIRQRAAEQLTTEVSRLKAEHERNAQQLISSKQQAVAEQEEIRQRAAEQLTTEVSRLKAEHERNAQQLISAKQQAVAEQEEIRQRAAEQLSNVKQGAAAEHDQMRHQMVEQEARFKERLAAETTNLKNQVADAEAKAQAAQGMYDKVSEQLREKREEINELTKFKREAEYGDMSARQQMRKLETQAADAGHLVASLKERLVTEETRAAIAEKDLKVVKDQLTSAVKTIEGLEEAVQAGSVSEQNTLHKAQTTQKEVIRLQELLAETRSRSETLEKQMNQYQKQVEQYQEVIQRAEQQTSQLHQKLSLPESSIAGLRSSKITLDNLGAVVAALERKLEAGSEEVNKKVKVAQEEAVAQVKQYESQVARLQERLQNQENRTKEAEKRSEKYLENIRNISAVHGKDTSPIKVDTSVRQMAEEIKRLQQLLEVESKEAKQKVKSQKESANQVQQYASEVSRLQERLKQEEDRANGAEKRAEKYLENIRSLKNNQQEQQHGSTIYTDATFKQMADEIQQLQQLLEVESKEAKQKLQKANEETLAAQEAMNQATARLDAERLKAQSLEKMLEQRTKPAVASNGQESVGIVLQQLQQEQQARKKLEEDNTNQMQEIHQLKLQIAAFTCRDVSKAPAGSKTPAPVFLNKQPTNQNEPGLKTVAAMGSPISGGAQRKDSAPAPATASPPSPSVPAPKPTSQPKPQPKLPDQFYQPVPQWQGPIPMYTYAMPDPCPHLALNDSQPAPGPRINLNPPPSLQRLPAGKIGSGIPELPKQMPPAPMKQLPPPLKSGAYMSPPEGEYVTKHIYNYQQNEWTRQRVLVRLDKYPFEEGAMRSCFYLKDLSKPKGPAQDHVAKFSKDPDEPLESYFLDCEMQVLAGVLADQFSGLNVPKKITYCDVFVFEFPDRVHCKNKGPVLMCVEPYLTGTFTKYTNNYGWVNPQKARATPQAYSHFTNYITGGALVVVDVQGFQNNDEVEKYTDPQIMTRSDQPSFGRCDLRQDGISKFFETHQCNSICVALQLPKPGEPAPEPNPYNRLPRPDPNIILRMRQRGKK